MTTKYDPKAYLSAEVNIVSGSNLLKGMKTSEIHIESSKVPSPFPYASDLTSLVSKLNSLLLNMETFKNEFQALRTAIDNIQPGFYQQYLDYITVYQANVELAEREFGEEKASCFD